MRLRAKKMLDTLCCALVGLAVVLFAANLLIFLTGQAASLNSFLASDSLRHVFVSEPGAYGDTSPEVLRDVLVNFYLPVIIMGGICGVVFVLVLLDVIVNALATLGRIAINLVARRLGERDVRYRLLIIFGVWTLAIISVWLVLNIDETIYYLLAGVGLMAINLLLGWVTQDYVVDEAKEEVKQLKANKEAA